VDKNDDFRLLVKANQLLADVDEEMERLHRFIADLYVQKFFELESLLFNKVDYAKAVRMIRNEADMTKVNLSSFLPPAIVMIVTVTSSTSSGQPLSPSQLEQLDVGASEVIRLSEDRERVLRYVSSQVLSLCPNLSFFIGSNLSARMLALAGGLDALASIPACNLQVMGKAEQYNSGLSSSVIGRHEGMLFECDLVQNAPPRDSKESVEDRSV
jgi:U4/U6 small nuclear ribonucleoprotein PRP31